MFQLTALVKVYACYATRAQGVHGPYRVLRPYVMYVFGIRTTNALILVFKLCVKQFFLAKVESKFEKGWQITSSQKIKCFYIPKEHPFARKA